MTSPFVFSKSNLVATAFDFLPPSKRSITSLKIVSSSACLAARLASSSACLAACLASLLAIFFSFSLLALLSSISFFLACFAAIFAATSLLKDFSSAAVGDIAFGFCCSPNFCIAKSCNSPMAGFILVHSSGNLSLIFDAKYSARLPVFCAMMTA